MSHLPSSLKILIVEDEWIIALDIKRHLSKLGYDVAGTANCAEKALELVAETKPDLVLMDIYLQGGTTGIKVAELMRQQFHLPIVFLTAHTDEATLTEAIAIHPGGYVVKPFDEQDLSVAIQVAWANHRAERAIQQALEKEKQLNQLKSQFISMVSHEFRNPLCVLAMMSDMLLRFDSQLTLEKKEMYAQQINAAIDYMSQLLEEVILLGKVDNGDFQIELTTLNLEEFCNELTTTLKIIDSHQHPIISIYQQDLAPVQLDANVLRHILNNLISNSLKYSPPDREVRVEVSCQDNTAVFCICDRGIGIPKKEQHRLFETFSRCSNVGKIKGTGLGLAIVKHCVDLHGGKICVESEVGIGTKVTVSLPIGT
jgi:signal transduction histidine kinase